jgi:hypothetical protein
VSTIYEPDYKNSLCSVSDSPLLGGWLSNPYERYPSTFGRFEFWRTYPYALPCFVVAVYCITSWLLAFLFLDEVCFLTYHRPMWLPTDVRLDSDKVSSFEPRGRGGIVTPTAFLPIA